MQVLIYEKAAASWIMLTTIFFFFSAFCTNANIALMQTHEKEAAERRWRQVDGTIEAEQQRGLVFYYKLTAFDRSWLIHWKLKKVSPSFFLFFLSPYIRLGMNQVVLFFFCERTGEAEARATDLLWCPTLPLIFCFIELQVFVFLHLHYDHGRKYISYQRQTI